MFNNPYKYSANFMGHRHTEQNQIRLLTICMLDIFFMILCRLLTFFKIDFIQKKSGSLSECQTVWRQIRTDVLSVLIWVQTVYNSLILTDVNGHR